MEPLYFEDFEPGRKFATAGKTISEAEILEFALKYDPQPFHMDREAAKNSIYGGLIASGIQTLAVALRLIIQRGVLCESSLGSPGIDELRWLKPVRPGDTLSARMTVLETIPSRSKPDRGILRSLLEMRNQRDETVVTVRGLSLLGRRPAAPGQPPRPA